MFRTLRTTVIIAGISAAILGIAAMMACNGRASSDKPVFMVSVSPLKYVVESITGDDFDIQVMVPDGSSPETYSPTSQQMIDIEKARFVFTTGLIDFEIELINKLSKTLNDSNIIDLGESIALIEGHCVHADNENHTHNTSEHTAVAGNRIDSRNHGIDPHIWTSPEQLKVISTNAYNAIMTQYPDSVKYTTAYHNLLHQLDSVSTLIRTGISGSGHKYFMIYHPALTYYARDYGIEQIALENEGKEPSAAYMKEMAARGKKDKIKYILYQRQFSKSTVESLASDIGATAVAVDPLAENIIEEILNITDIITR